MQVEDSTSITHVTNTSQFELLPRQCRRNDRGLSRNFQIYGTMAVQSKLLLHTAPSDRSLKRLVSALTELYLKHRTKISRTVYLTLSVALINRVRNAISEQKAASFHQAQTRQRPGTAPNQGEANVRKRIELNSEFFRALWRLMKIVIPGWKSKELRLIISHSIFLVIRTLLSLYVAELDGKLVSSLVRGKGKEFFRGIVWWMIVAVPATFTNSMVGMNSPSLPRMISKLMNFISCHIINAS